MSSLEEINLHIIRLKKLKIDYTIQKTALDLIGHEMDEIKQTILDELKAAKALSYKTQTGTVSITRRQTVKITDEMPVRRWLEVNGFDLEEYTTLDKVRTKPILENAVYQQGEVIDGTALETSEYISLREPTNKKEAA